MKVWVVTVSSIFGGPVLAVCDSERTANGIAYLHQMRARCVRAQERRDFTLRDGRRTYGLSKDEYRRILEGYDPESMPVVTGFEVSCAKSPCSTPPIPAHWTSPEPPKESDGDECSGAGEDDPPGA